MNSRLIRPRERSPLPTASHRPVSTSMSTTTRRPRRYAPADARFHSCARSFTARMTGCGGCTPSDRWGWCPALWRRGRRCRRPNWRGP